VVRSTCLDRLQLLQSNVLIDLVQRLPQILIALWGQRFLLVLLPSCPFHHGRLPSAVYTVSQRAAALPQELVGREESQGP
jgi:hypothetical protein